MKMEYMHVTLYPMENTKTTVQAGWGSNSDICGEWHCTYLLVTLVDLFDWSDNF